MRRFLLILPFIPFLLFGQTDLKPKVAWRTNVSNVTMLTDSTYQFEVMPIDWNEAGASEMRYGNYFQDYAGNKYKIIDSTYLKVTVYDVFKTGVSPQPDRIGIMYLTPLDGESDYLAPVNYSYLDQSALDNARGIELAYLWKNINQFPQTGVVQLPVITRVGDGTITLDGGVVSINTLASGQGRNVTFNMPDTTLTPTDNGVSFVYADYNSGEPVYRITTNRDQFLTNFTLIPVIRISREGTIIHFLEYDEYGVQLANKMNLKDIFISGFQRESGLILSTAEGRISTVSAGRVVFSVQWWNMAANTAGTAGDLYEYYRVGGAWNKTLVTSYDATYYCDGVNRLTLSNNQFVSKYFFRDAGDDNEVYYIHGNTYNKFSDALAEPLPPSPDIITSHSIYVGKIVIEQGATNGIAFPRAWDTALEKSSTQRHGDLTELTWVESGHTGELNSVAGFDSLGTTAYIGLDTIQFARDTLTWDATKKDLSDSTSYLKTLIEQAEARFPNFANSLQAMTGTQDTLIMTPLMVYEMIQMLSIQPYGEEEDLYLKGRKITSDSLIVDAMRAENDQIELIGNLQVGDTLKVEKIQLLNGYTEGYYLKIGANGNVIVSAISGAMVYKGTWDASTNTPTLADGIGTNGWYYRVVTGGTQNLGSGNITFSAGDDVLYDGLVWQRVPSPTYTLQPATSTVLGGVKIGSNINVTEDGTISTHAQQNISTNGLAGNISISNGSTLNLNVNDADASATNEIQAISILNDVISITKDDSTVDLGYLQDSISSVRGYVNTVKGVILSEINLGKDSIRFEVDTLKTSLYDSIYSHRLRLEDLEALDIVEFSDLSGIRDSVSNNKDSIVAHNMRLLSLESLDIIEGSDLSGIRDSISVNLDSIQAHNLRLLVVEGLDTSGIYHFNRELLDQITSKAQLVSDTLVWDATKNDLKVMVRDSISGLRSELTAYFDLKLSDSTAYLRTMISDSTLFLRGELSNLESELKDSILDHRTEIDSLKNVTSSLVIPEKATTLETATSTENEDYVTPKTLKEFLELSYVPYYGSNEDIYTKKVTADSLILRDLTGEGIRAVAVNSKGKLIDTLLVFDDISELALWNKGQSDSIKGLLYWNQIQSDSLKIIADSLAFYVVTGDDSIQAHRVELEALKDSIFDHRTELEIIKDTLVDHNLRLIPLERLDTTGIYHDNRDYLDLLADQAQERRDTLTFDATKYYLRKMVGDSTLYLKGMIGDSTEYLRALISDTNTEWKDSILAHRNILNSHSDSLLSHDLRLIEVEGLDTVGIYHINRSLLDVITVQDTAYWGDKNYLNLVNKPNITDSIVSYIGDSISIAYDSIQAHNLRLLQVEGLDTLGLYHTNRGVLDLITAQDTVNWNGFKKWDKDYFDLINRPSIKDSVDFYQTDSQTLSIDSTNRVFTIAISNGNSIKFKDENTIYDLSNYAQYESIDSLRNEIDSLSVSVYDSIYSHSGKIEIIKANYQSKSDTLTWDATKYDLKKMVGDSTALILDSISAHNLRLITLEGKNYILFSDTMDLIGTKYDIEEARFTNSDEIDPIYSQDSIKIVWFKDLRPVQDSLKTAFDTLSVHNTRLLALEIDTAYWNNKVSQEELADSTWLLRDLIRHATVEKSDDLKALTGSNDLTYISPEKLVEVIKMLSFQNFGQLEDVYAPTITLIVDSLKVGLIEGEAFIESGTLKSKVASTNFTGLINGINKTFILEGIPKDLDIYLNGVYQVLNKDFTLSGLSVIFVKTPYIGDEITIKYTY